ncbi:MAG: protein kinase [Deltaproteobacteria bacterium]|nr:protein kinase [Deltaproteobacteria bacterium]
MNQRSTRQRPPDPLIGRIIADRYRLEARAGEGGIGAVYRARHLLIDRIVAIKILQPVRRGETHHRDWFLREARAANRVNHANIVDIYDFGDTEDGLYYLVMEYLEGEPLSHVIARGAMPIDRTVDILEQTCAAMARAHDLGVIHRDIKSDNVFLTQRGGRPDYVKVFDFGLASLSHDARLAPEGAVFGTPEYMSPEQTRGEEAVPQSDLYALGVLFFEMLTGRLPFVSNERKEILRMHQEAKPPSLRQFRADLDQETDQIILKLLEKKAEDRYRDAHHLLEDLKRQQRASPRDIPTPLPRRGSRTSVFAPAQAAGPLTSGLSAWALRSVMFGRMVAQANPRISQSPPVRRSLDDLWRLCTQAAKTEASISNEASRVEGYEKRARETRAQFGRQIEELGGEESRLRRQISDAQRQSAALRKEQEEASRSLDEAWAEIARLEIDGDDAELRRAYERAGAARARFSARSQEMAKLDARIAHMSASLAAIAARLLELKESLNRHDDALETALNDARRRVAGSGRDRAQILRDLERSAHALYAELAPAPECRELLAEMDKLVGPLPVLGVNEEELSEEPPPMSETNTEVSALDKRAAVLKGQPLAAAPAKPRQGAPG